VLDRATELRSALKFSDAAALIETVPDYERDDELLALHADSLFKAYQRKPGEGPLEIAVTEFKSLIDRTGSSRVPDIITYIEAQRERSEKLAEDEGSLTATFAEIEELADNAQGAVSPVESLREWSLMGFYAAEAVQAQAEAAKRDAQEEAGSSSKKERKARLEDARQRYARALPGLSKTDAIKARECKEGLAGALIGLSEYERGGGGAASHLREAQTLFREVVESARINTPGERYAGALENLADAIRSARVKFNDEAHGSRAEEKLLIRMALEIYEESGDEHSAGRMRGLLTR